ncbi:BMP family ABC transporter substrate-binding protein [Trueperella pecoris]|uniref:BMP family ABC transporter substrate-binding protein n=1 Tax=Trueperella pecoris TaxID=2733571 RepID=A0A7M1QZ02_9ACTO|nr:BMP family ABC transporter substrate-binding protein [Trueperella pecoris]QOR47061.1 BMP family ABC transporter substrate-binding protein [Trueperella pecoris]
MRNFKKFAAVAAATALALSACSNGADGGKSTDGGEAKKDFKACLVSDAGGWDDHSFNESAKAGLDDAVKEYGIQFNTAESKNDNDFAPNTKAMVDDGCNLIIGVGFKLNSAIATEAQNNKDLQFALIDSVFTDKDFKPIELENGRPLLFNTQEAAYLAGYVAAGMTKTGKVGTFGGMSIPSVTIFMDGFVDGVKAYNEAKGTDVQVLGWDKDTQVGDFTQTFDDAQLGKSHAQQMIDQGADIIMPVAGPVGAGAAQAAKASGKAIIIGVDSDWYESYADYKDIILTSVQKGIAASVKDTIKSELDKKFSAEPYVGTIANGGVSISPFHDFDSKVPADLKKEVKDLEEKIKSGELKVESPSANK